jgi:alanyl-tRNA synthetase
MGDTGPCGPCSEIFYDHGEEIAGGPPGTPEEDGDRFIEIWNLVFMQFDKQADGELLPLPKPCVDTGMGLERITSIMQGQHNNYEIDLFQHIIKYIAELLSLEDLSSPSLKVIADHIRTCSFLVSDGIQPGNEGRGYVLRRIIRRAIRHGYKLGANETFFYKILSPLIDVMGDAYPELVKNKDSIQSALKKEELRFAETLELGMGLLNKAINELQGKIIPGEVAFKLYDTYGFPLDLTQDVAREHGLIVDETGFDQCMQEQKQRSKASGGFVQGNQIPSELLSTLEATKFTGYDDLSATGKIVALIQDGKSVKKLDGDGIVILDKTPFYAESGGQIGDSGKLIAESVAFNVLDTQKAAGQFFLHVVQHQQGEIVLGQVIEAIVESPKRTGIKLNHTATHLLHKVLQEQLGSHVQQKGSIVSNDKLRFDFSQSEPITAEQLTTIEREVNQHIRANYDAVTKIMSFDEAVETGAMALFGEKYGDEVRVLNIGDYSIELCGGTHVKCTGEIGLFKIVSEASIAAGIRRIEAVTGEVAVNYVQNNEAMLNIITQLTHASSDTVTEKVKSALVKNKELEKTIQVLENQLAGNAAEDLWKNVEELDGVHYLFEVLPKFNSENMKSIADKFRDKFKDGVMVLANHNEANKVQLICSVGKILSKKVKAGDIIRTIAGKISGKGGGRPDFAQGGGESDIKNLKTVMQESISEVKKLLKNE